MVTYAQLEAESWYRREIVTPELAQFGDWVREHYDLAADAIGNKGNNAHLNGSHRSQEWILNSRYCTNRTYTVQPGLTADQARLIAGEDITPKTTADMLAMSKRIDQATRAGRLEEVVAWYGNVNGDTRVDGYDNIRNVAASSDASHLWHLHLSLDRRVLRDINVMRRIYAALTGTKVDDMALTEWCASKPAGLRDDQLTQGTLEQDGSAGDLASGHYGKQQRDTALAGAAESSARAAKLAQQILEVVTPVTHGSGTGPSQAQVTAALSDPAVVEVYAEAVAAKLAARLQA